MIVKGSRSQGIPFIVSDKLTKKLERIPLTEKLFQENWLQELIQSNPQILPIDDIEVGFSPLLSLGREISTNVGSIDNLFISPDGYITIVETKLWRNPEAKREVVGQILDYAKELANWTFTDFNNEIKKRNSENFGILDIINKYEPQDEQSKSNLIDNIERNLKRGRFLLLIVGDGIRESVEEMVDYLSNSAQLLFTLGLVELQIYKEPFNENGVIVIPNLITRTREITRAVIKIENNTSSTISIETNFNENKPNKKSRITLTEEDFFELLRQNTNNEDVEIAKRILERFKNEGYVTDWRQSTFVLKFPDPNGSGAKITLLQVSKNGDVNIGFSSFQLNNLGMNVEISHEFAKKTASLFNSIKVKEKYPDTWNKWVKLKEFSTALDEFLQLCDEFSEKIIKESKAVANNSYM